MSLHLEAEPGDIAETVLLPGDPQRAELIARYFLKEVRQYNQTRGMLGFTGTYRNHRVSVQGTGMGIPSMCIYATELIDAYGAKTLIRVGTAGSLQSHVELGQLVVGIASSTDSSALSHSTFYDVPLASAKLLQCAFTQARTSEKTVHFGKVFSSDLFYHPNPDYWQQLRATAHLAIEMETAGLYRLGQTRCVDTLSILAISDHIPTGRNLSKQERVQSGIESAALALEVAFDRTPDPLTSLRETSA